MNIRWTEEATTSLEQISLYIAEDNVEAAFKTINSIYGRIEQAIYDACAFIAEALLRGHSRPDLTARSLRSWTLTRYPNYALVYRPDTAPLQIVAVIHGKRIFRAF
jgi:plasmid stabilization system protein ParE